jgi:aarF domain-containing kinase
MLKRQLFAKSEIPLRKSNWGRRGLLLAATTGGGLYLVTAASDNGDKDATLTEKVDKSITASTRSMRTIKTCVEMVWDYQWTLRSANQPEVIGHDEYLELKSECHKRSAERLLRLCRQNGGVFTKLGQHLSAMVYLLPREYTTTLKVLQDQCPASSLKDIDDMFLLDTGKSLNDWFSEFDPEPLGVASLAQVHRAVLRASGKEVAVKIQHPSLDEYTAIDVQTVVSTVHWVKKAFPDFEFAWLADEMRNSLPKEMDFAHEALNANKVRKNFDKSSMLKIPLIYDARRRILIMECKKFIRWFMR